MLLTKTSNIASKQATACQHCGEPCEDNVVLGVLGDEQLHFCCEGCKMVYEILNDNGLGLFYTIESKAGISLKDKAKVQYAYLDDENIVAKLIDFRNEKITKATFHIPQIHCASCIWLLENLYKLSDSILASKVNFLKKEVYITFSNSAISYRTVVELLASIGYDPAINLSDLDAPQKQTTSKQFYYQLGIAGFAFGNIMLLSLPEYFGLEDSAFQRVFGYLNILLILPVVFYSAKDYLRSAWQGIRQSHLNIDVPISLGILTLFSRSVFEILTHTGAGYLDSLAGLVFFLLVGKWFQQTTYHQLSFERDYKSYFPIAAAVLKNGVETSVALSQLVIGDQILLRNGELIPTDGILQKGEAKIDYSFVTGESEPIHKKIGDKLYAGGRQMGSRITMTVTKKVTQSYLTQLWNDQIFQTNANSTPVSDLANKIGKYFTFVILAIAFLTLAYWLPKDLSTAINAFTSVLIIACPCAVALSIPFTFGNALRLLGRVGFYIKNTSVIEQINTIDAIVFDKTGTITKANSNQLSYQGKVLNASEAAAVYALAKQSSHPISRQISSYFHKKSHISLPIHQFEEIVGTGIKGQIGDFQIELLKATPLTIEESNSSTAFKKGTTIRINGKQKGIFSSQNQYRNGWKALVKTWQQSFDLFLLSGDNDKEKENLGKLLPLQNIHFNQRPSDKLAFIKYLQKSGKKVLMLGDGLNDAGALKQADVGIVIAENTNNFTPACDAILDAKQFEQLSNFFHYLKNSFRIVYAAYGLAFIYNVIGLSFAVQGNLSPVIAAILMPLSSITIVVFGVGMTYLYSRQWSRNQR